MPGTGTMVDMVRGAPADPMRVPLVGRAVELREMRQWFALADDGVFLFDAVVPRGGSTDHIGVRSMTADRVVLSVSRLDVASRRITGQFVEFADGTLPRLRPWSVRWWTPAEIAAAGTTVGLSVTSLWSDGAGAPFDDSSERMVVQMRRMAPHEEASRVVS